MPLLNPKPYRRFNRAILASAGGVVLLFVAANTWTNPLWVTPAPWTNEDFADFRPIYRHQRTGKAGLVLSRPWEVGFFGSSRIDIAYNPLHPLWEGKPAVNVAVSAGSLPETSAILRYTLEHCPLDTAIVGIDLGDITDAGSIYRTTGFMESPFNPKRDRFESQLRYLGGISTFESAVQTLQNKASNKLPEYTPQGHRLRHQDQPNTRQIIYRDAIPHALRTTSRRQHSMAASEWKTSLVRQILADTKAHGARLIVVIPPSHATYIGVFHHSGDPDPVFSIDRSVLTRLVAESNRDHPNSPPAVVWDFNDFHPLNCETIPPDGVRMHWWLDGTHARKSLGDIMLARIMGWPITGAGSDYGYLLTEETLPARLGELKSGYQRFQKENADQWRWMIQSLDSYQASGRAAKGSTDEDSRDF